MKQTQRKQHLVKLNNEKEGNEFIEYLEQNGLINVQKILFQDLRIKVIVVDNEKFWATNATCLAALAGSKIYPISIDEFKNKVELGSQTINL